MFTSRKHTILGLALCAAAAAGAASPALAGHAPAAPVAPKLSVTGHVGWYWLNPYSPMPYTTLHVTGSNFAPGARVNLAVVNTFRWEVIARGVTHAQPARIMVLCGHDFRTCYLRNPRAGTIEYRLRFNSAPAASNLLLLYRTAGDAGMQGVAVR